MGDPARGLEVDVVDPHREHRHRAQPRRRLEQLRVDAVGEQAEEAVDITACGVEVGRGGGVDEGGARGGMSYASDG